MKRMIVSAALALAALLGVTSLAGSQTIPVRAATQQVTSSTTPHRDRSRPYTFTTRGKVVPPPYCAVGVNPTVAGGTCVPRICPAGAAVIYCVPPPTAYLCTGKVTITFKKIFFTISTRSVGLRPDCTYSSKVSFRTTNPLRRGTLKVATRFQGNSFLLPKTAPRHTVRAG